MYVIKMIFSSKIIAWPVQVSAHHNLIIKIIVQTKEACSLPPNILQNVVLRKYRLKGYFLVDFPLSISLKVYTMYKVPFEDT